MGKKLLGLFLLVAAVCSFASLTIHIQSPWRNDASKSGYALHILGGTSSYNAEYGSSSKTIMTDEGNGWFSYTWSKDVSGFQEWETFSVALYPNTADQNFNNNNKVAWTEAGNIKIVPFFGTEKELWLYTNTSDMSYTVSFVAPGSKMVWFKSPWGNKALPDLVLAKDTVMMRFVMDDATKCGWFYAALSPAVMKRNPLQSGFFMRHLTPYMTTPAKGVLDLGTHLNGHDTIFVDGTAATPKVTYSIGSLGTCFDSTYVLHIYHPWRTNTSFRDSAVYISVGNNILNNPVATEKDSYPYWYHYDFAPATVKSANWGSPSALFNIYRRQNEWPQVVYFSDAQRPQASTLFPLGVYESWLYTSSEGRLDLQFTPPEPKVIRLMSPWDNMTPTMFVEGDTIKMGPFHSDTCGWYQGVSYKRVESWDVYFRQAFGFEYFSRSGIDTIPGTMINLDSVFAVSDTAWITSIPFKITSSYPRLLGVCPAMKISALVVDWAGEGVKIVGSDPYNPEEDLSQDVDFGHIYNDDRKNTYIKVEFNGVEYDTCRGLVTGMVLDTLVNGLPARVDSMSFPWHKCSAAHEIEKWFVPQVVGKDASGKEYTNGVCRDIDLILDEEGFWLADISESHEDGGFFPIDDLEYLDSAKTVKNPKFDWDNQLTAGGKPHNYSFAMKISAQFKYVKGQYFEFRGDDDVWVFINNRLAVDIGGCHGPIEKAIDLDTLGLVEGVEYPFYIFFSERNATGSNFKMRTSINLQTEKTYFSKQKENPDGSVEYEFHQLLVDKSVSCDVASVQNARDQLAQSLFVLKGGALPIDGVTLESGLNYGGILISENMASFVVDTSAFVNSRTLSPGKYSLICYLATDRTQYQIVTFTVPEYPLPNIAFVNVFHLSDSLLMDSKGLTLRGDSLGAEGRKNDTLWAYAAYPDTVPLQIVLLFGNTPCGQMEDLTKVNCKEKVFFHSDFPISFMDENFQWIDTLETDSLGYAKFYVVGDSAMVDAYFTLSGPGIGNELVWSEIHFKEPPVPIVKKSQMFDVDGNGIPDSLVMYFSKAFEDVVPDTLKWIFGGEEEHKVADMKNIWPLVKKDSILVLYDKNGLRKDIFTGLTDQVYSGTLNYHYTYIDEDSGDEVKLILRAGIEDKVAPVIRSAMVQTVNDNSSMVVINLSEGTEIEKLNPESTFVFFRGGKNFMDSLLISGGDIRGNGNVAKVYFRRSASGVLPVVGDSVRLVPGVFGDRSGNKAHQNNPKVRIEGEQRTEIKSPGVITISSDLEKWPYKESIVPVSVPADMSVHDVIDSLGMPGFLLSFNMGEVATTLIANLPSDVDLDSALSLIKMEWEGYYFSHLGSFVNKAKGTLRCNDKEVFYNASNPARSNCLENPGNIFFEWNARSENGRLVGTGPYISKIKVKIYSGKNVEGKNEDVYTLGIRRGK